MTNETTKTGPDCWVTPERTQCLFFEDCKPQGECLLEPEGVERGEN